MREHKTSLIKYKFLTLNSINDSIFGSIRFRGGTRSRGRTMDKVVTQENFCSRSCPTARPPLWLVPWLWLLGTPRTALVDHIPPHPTLLPKEREPGCRAPKSKRHRF